MRQLFELDPYGVEKSSSYNGDDDRIPSFVVPILHRNTFILRILHSTGFEEGINRLDIGFA